MNISGIRPTTGFYDYNDIRAKQVAQLQDVMAPVTPVNQVTDETKAPSESEIAAAKAKQTFGAYDYAKQYDARETYSMKGADSDLMSLDITNAVNEMRKDSAIQQYQYFVGKEDVTATASVRATENFSL